jgi:phage terminase small subunit
VNEIRTLRAGFAARTKDAAVAKINTALAAVQDELVDLRFAGYYDQMLVFDLKLNNRMAALQGYVSRGDYAPTEQQYAVFKELSTQIDAALARFKALKTQIPPPR